MKQPKKPFLDPDTQCAGLELELSPYKYGGTANGHGKAETSLRRRADDGIIDPVAIVRALRGEVVKISNREVLAAVALGASLGLSDGEIGERLCLAERNVFLKRRDNKIPPSRPARTPRANREKAA